MDQADRHRLQLLMIRLADGDRSAFDSLFDLAWPVMLHFARRALRGAPEADDAAQNAMIRLMQRASRFDRDRNALSWILAITANEIRTQRRRRPSWVGLEHAPQTHDPQLSSEQKLIQQQTIEALDQAYGELSECDRRVVLEALGFATPSAVNAATWRKRWQRARERLRALWRAEQNEH
jgi:RNA polymerase sigma-70 factor (ECF subfamily)